MSLDRDPDEAARKGKHLIADLEKPHDVAQSFEKAREALGGIDLLVNDAGAFRPVDPLALDPDLGPPLR